MRPTSRPTKPITRKNAAPAWPVDWKAELAKMLRKRSIDAGIALLDATEPLWGLSGDAVHKSPSFLLTLAQWVDVGYRDSQLVRRMLDILTPDDRLELKVGDYVRVQMAEAFYALDTDNVDSCIVTLENILRLNSQLLEPDLATLAHLWKARAHRKQADYVRALEHINAAHELALKLPDSAALTAVIQVQQSWVLFQRGNTARSIQVLDLAEAVLKRTDHWIALGNIESARGRIVRRKGDYAQSMQHFKRAIALYEKRSPPHPNLSRAAINLAFVKRLLALQLTRHIDHIVQAGRGGGHKARSAKDRLTPLHRQHRELYQSAISDLERAKQICTLHQQHAGVASALLNAGYLHLDGGNLELILESGKGKMPAFGDRLSPDDMHHLLAYLHTL